MKLRRFLDFCRKSNDEILAFAKKHDIARTTALRFARDLRRKTGHINLQRIPDLHRKALEAIALQEPGYKGVEKYAIQHGIMVRAAKKIACKILKSVGIKVAKKVAPEVKAEIERLSLQSPTNEKVYDYASKNGVPRETAHKIAYLGRKKFGSQKVNRHWSPSQIKRVKELALKTSINREIYEYAEQHNLGRRRARHYAARARREAKKTRRNIQVTDEQRQKIQALALKYKSYGPIKEYAKQKGINYTTAQRIAREYLKAISLNPNIASKILPVQSKSRRFTSDEEKQHIEKLALESPTNEKIRLYAQGIKMNKGTACKFACQVRKRHGVDLQQNNVSSEDKQKIESLALKHSTNEIIYKFAEKKKINKGTAINYARLARLRAGADAGPPPTSEETEEKIKFLVLQGKSNEEIYQELGGKTTRGTVTRFARRYRRLFGISRFMTDDQMETIKKMALQDRDNRRIYLYAEKERINKGTAQFLASKVRREHKQSSERIKDPPS